MLDHVGVSKGIGLGTTGRPISSPGPASPTTGAVPPAAVCVCATQRRVYGRRADTKNFVLDVLKHLTPWVALKFTYRKHLKVSSYGTDGQGSVPERSRTLRSPRLCPDRLREPSSVISGWYQRQTAAA